MSRSLGASFRKPQPVRSTWLAWLCALCLLAVQGLGHWHAIAHSETPAQHRLQGQAEAAKAPDGWGHHSGDADCHVFDHLSHEQGLAGSAALDCAALAHLAPTAPIWAGAEIASRWKRGARAPPPYSA